MIWHFTCFLCVSFSVTLSNAQVTSLQRQEILNAHNWARRAVYPEASNMNYLTWNFRLEELAFRAAKKCVFEHNYGGDYEGLGENLYKGFRSNVTEIIFYFTMEKYNYNYTASKCMASDPRNIFNFPGVCGHYWQTVGATISEVGCSIYNCGTNSNLFVCEYNSPSPSPIYHSGPPCSTCLASRGFCYEGLCLNDTTKAEVIKSNTKAQIDCNLICKNCGVKVETSSSCNCSCTASSFTNADCSVLKSGTSKPEITCSSCVALGTPCLNGASELSGNASRCSCLCAPGFVGDQCQLPEEALAGGVLVKFRFNADFCTNGKCAPYPIPPNKWPAIWDSLRTHLTSQVNTFCNDSKMLSSCCPGISSAEGALYITVSDLKYESWSIRSLDSGYLEVLIYISLSGSNTLCPSLKMTAAPTSVLTSVLASSSSLNATLSVVHAAHIVDLKVFSTVAEAYVGSVTRPPTVTTTTTSTQKSSTVKSTTLSKTSQVHIKSSSTARPTPFTDIAFPRSALSVQGPLHAVILAAILALSFMRIHTDLWF